MAWLTQSEYARHRGCSRQAVSKAVKAGRIHPNEQGLIDADTADKAWAGSSSPTVAAASLRGVASTTEEAEAPATGAASTFAHARAVRENYLARTAKLEYEERSGKLVAKDLVRRATFEQHRKVRDMLLSLPDRVTPLLAETPEQRTKMYSVLTDEVIRALGELTGEFAANRYGRGAGLRVAVGDRGGGVPAPAAAAS